jgi:hypothetical protein
VPSTDRRSSTRAQRELYARVLLRDQYRCQLHYPGEWTVRGGHTRHCMGVADCIHHTRGPAVEDPAHLVAACTPCNLKVGEPSTTVDLPPRPMTTW